jgi:uncharacterized protein (DUF2252 family)
MPFPEDEDSMKLSVCTIRGTMLSLVFLAAGAVRAQEPTVYDAVAQSYAPFVDANDPLAMPMKFKTIAEGPYKFWRGAKVLYFQWAKDNAKDWLADRESWLTQHGDQHLGNIGTYPIDLAAGTVALGMIDFDDSCRLPFQLELLQDTVTVHFIAANNGILLTREQQQQLDSAVLESYLAAATSTKAARELLAHDEWVDDVFSKEGEAYSKEIKKYTHQGKFRPTVIGKDGTLKDILRPAEVSNEELAAAIAEGLNNNPEFKALWRVQDQASILASIKDAALRSRMGSSGSQGQKKYFVLLAKPLKDLDSDVIIYLKHEIPTSAERSGIIAADPRPGAKRYVEDVYALTDPRPVDFSWCTIGGGSYWMSVHQPWGTEFDPADVKTFEDLLHAAKIVGTATGASHREKGLADMIAAHMKSPGFGDEMSSRTRQCVTRVMLNYQRLLADPRLQGQIDAADRILTAMSAAKH